MSEDKLREQTFGSWLISQCDEFKDDLDITRYLQRNECALREGFKAGAKIKDAEIEQLNARVVMLREALKPSAVYGRVGSRDIDTAKCIKALAATEADVTKFINDVKAERDAEWMAEPAGVWHKGDTEEESDFFVGDQIDDKCECCVKLYVQPKDK